MSHPTDDDLSSLLHDAVDDVHPREGIEAIRARTATRRPVTGRWLPLTLATAAAVVLVIGGTAWIANVTRSDVGPAADGHRHTVTNDADAPGRDLNVPVAYVGRTASGPRLFLEYHAVRETHATPLQAAVTQVLSAVPKDPDYRNLLPLGVDAKATENGGLISIDLSARLDRPAGMDGTTAEMVVQSIVWTADTAASAGLAPVRFTVDGRPVDSVLGVDATRAVPPASADSVLAPVSIDSPSEGAHVSTNFDVRGKAAAAEGNVVWELKDGDEVVAHGFTTAAECCTLSPYSFSVAAPPGRYTLVVHDTDESDGEGVGTDQDTKTVVLE